MPFEPGHNLSKGRPKGSKNKFQVGDDVKQHIADLLAYKTERDFEDLDTMSPYERQRLKNELRTWATPKHTDDKSIALLVINLTGSIYS